MLRQNQEAILFILHSVVKRIQATQINVSKIWEEFRMLIRNILQMSDILKLKIWVKTGRGYNVVVIFRIHYKFIYRMLFGKFICIVLWVLVRTYVCMICMFVCLFLYVFTDLCMLACKYRYEWIDEWLVEYRV